LHEIVFNTCAIIKQLLLYSLFILIVA
jgi:hypothetical protein